MLSNLIYSLNAVAPIVLLVLLGVFFRRIGLVNEAFTAVSEKIVFRAALPVMLFLEVAQSSFAQAFDVRLILFCVASVTASFLLLSLLTSLFVKDPTKRGSFVQGACRSNFAILGVPLAENLFGSSGAATIALVMPFVILMFNVYSVVLLSFFSENRKNSAKNDEKLEDPGDGSVDNQSGKADGGGNARHPKNQEQAFRRAKTNRPLGTLLGTVKNIVTNPLIIGVALALPVMLFQWEIPVILQKSLGYVENLATPLALICLGANFKRESMKGRAGLAVASSLIKTVVLPFVMVALALLCGFRREALGVVLILFGAPTAVSSYIMAKNMGNDHELAAQILLFTTVLCAFTIFAGIFLLKTCNFI